MVGFEISKVKKYCLKYKNSCMIGAFELTFNQKSEFVFTALTDCTGFFIRREKWYELLTEHKDVSASLISNILYRYLLDVHFKCNEVKSQAFEQIEQGEAMQQSSIHIEKLIEEACERYEVERDAKEQDPKQEEENVL